MFLSLINVALAALLIAAPVELPKSPPLPVQSVTEFDFPVNEGACPGGAHAYVFNFEVNGIEYKAFATTDAPYKFAIIDLEAGDETPAWIGEYDSTTGKLTLEFTYTFKELLEKYPKVCMWLEEKAA